MQKPIIIALATLGLGGCASAYVAPSGADTAMVNFTAKDIGPNNNAYFLLVKPGPDCKKSVGQSLATLGRAINRDAATEFQRKVQTGNDIRIYSQWLQAYSPYGYSTCTVSAGIDLQPGRRYEMSLESGTHCSLHLYDLGAQGGGQPPTELPIHSYSVRSSNQLCDL